MKIYRYVTGPLSVNTYLVVDEETNKGFIVDPGGEDIDLLEFVKENNIEIEYIILTHGHGDHICGLESYQKAWPKASLIVHEEEHELLSDPRKNYSTMTCGRPLSFTADHYVQDGEILKAGGLEIKFVFTPGHTPGGMCVYVGDSLFSGDTLFARSIGRKAIYAPRRHDGLSGPYGADNYRDRKGAKSLCIKYISIASSRSMNWENL